MSSISTATMSEAQAITWIAQVLGEPPEILAPDVAREDVPSWDSLGMLMLISAFDEHFGILIPDSDVQRLNTINDVLAVLRAHAKIA